MAAATAAPLAVILAQQWSITAKNEGGPVARKTSAELATAVGRLPRADRKTDGRTLGDLRDAVDLLVATGFADKDYHLTAEKVIVRPGTDRSNDRIRRPPLLPATGHDLAVWLEEEGRPLTEVAAELGVNPRTLKRGVSNGYRCLSPELRGAFRRYLWSHE